MSVRKFWREVYLTVMVTAALAIIITASLFLSDLTGLTVIAAGVFVSVLGVGVYDQWQDAALSKERIKTRR